MTSPTPPPPAPVGPSFGSLLVGSAFGPPGIAGALAWDALSDLVDKAESLFGDGKPAGPQGGFVGGGGSFDHGAPPPAQGGAADAEKKAADDLAKKTDALKSLDDQLDALSKQIVSDNDDAKKKLVALKGEIDKELDYAKTSGDTSVVKDQAVSKFLQDKADEVAGVITAAAQSISKNQQSLNQIGNGYNTDPSLTPAAPGTDPSVAGGGAAPADPYASGGYGGGYGDDYGSDGGYGDGYGDGYGSDPMSSMADMLPQLGSMLPGALGGLGGGMGASPLGDLGSLLSSAARDAGNSQDHKTDDATDNKKDDPKPDDKVTPPVTNNQNQPATGAPQPGTEQTGSGAQPSTAPPPPPPAPPAPTLVTRPDGTSATAPSAATAAASRAHLGGADLVPAYKDANIQLPPVGTPLKDTLPPSATGMGDLAAFKDRYVMLLGDGKVYLDGKEQPLSALAKLPGFLGFFRPAAPPDATAAQAAPPPAPSTSPAGTAT